MDPALVMMCTETVQHAAFVSRDETGKPTYAAAVERLVRIEWVSIRFVNTQGEERTSRAILYLPWDFDLQMTHRLTLPDGTSPGIQKLEAWRDEVGQPHHYRVIV